MRRKDREITEEKELREILDQCMVCRLGMQDEAGLYIVPLNYGYAFEEDRLVLYFHCAKEGRKVGALKANQKVCFEMDCGHSLAKGETACQYGYFFKSLIGNGTAAFIEETEEKKQALSILMKHQTGQVFSFDEKMTDSVLVFKVVADSYTGKARKMG